MLERFKSVFSGYEKAYGTFEVKYLNESKGKREGQAYTLKGEAPDDVWEGHLAGTNKGGIGIVPLREDDTCLFGVIDIDSYTISLEGLSREIKQRSLPLVVCRSKSGGAHVYCFLAEPVPAESLITKLNEWAALLGYSGSEIFPKQSHRASEDDIGNWINLPYYDSEVTNRYAIIDGEALDLEQFLDYVENNKATYEQITAAAALQSSAEDEDDLLLEAPPCLRQLRTQGGFPEGTRNEGMYSVCVYLRKRYGEDEWEDHLPDYNDVMCDPAIDPKELRGLSRSVGRKDYQYKCNQAPLKSVCNKQLCRSQKYGVGASTGQVEITGVTKYESQPVLWVIEVEGKRVMLNTEDLYSQTNFNRKCMEQVNRVPASMPAARWTKYLDDLIQQADVVVVPEDASEQGQFLALVEDFCSTEAFARNKAEILWGKPYIEEGMVYFRSSDLIQFLKERRFKVESGHHVWQGLRQIGVEKKQENIEGRGVNLWYVKAPKSVTEREKKVGPESF